MAGNFPDDGGHVGSTGGLSGSPEGSLEHGILALKGRKLLAEGERKCWAGAQPEQRLEGGDDGSWSGPRPAPGPPHPPLHLPQVSGPLDGGVTSKAEADPWAEGSRPRLRPQDAGRAGALSQSVQSRAAGPAPGVRKTEEISPKAITRLSLLRHQLVRNDKNVLKLREAEAANRPLLFGVRTPPPPSRTGWGIAWVANSTVLAGIRGLLATHRARVRREQSRVAHLFGVCRAPHK